MNTRGVNTLWHVYVHVWIWGGCSALDLNDLGAQRRLGNPRIVPFSLDCCETLSWPATIRSIDKIDHWGLFQSADKISRALFCKVSLEYECSYLSLLKFCALVSFVSLASSLVFLLQSPWYADLLLTFACDPCSSFIWNLNSTETQILYGACEIFLGVQMFVLGPRLILSVREYHIKLVIESDAEISMTSIVFQERVHVPTGSTV
jgi:hypothetical protein